MLGLRNIFPGPSVQLTAVLPPLDFPELEHITKLGCVLVLTVPGKYWVSDIKRPPSKRLAARRPYAMNCALEGSCILRRTAGGRQVLPISTLVPTMHSCICSTTWRSLFDNKADMVRGALDCRELTLPNGVRNAVEPSILYISLILMRLGFQSSVAKSNIGVYRSNVCGCP